jgi:putative endonuclease
MVWTYVLQFDGGRLYVGLTKNMARRMEEHARRQSPSTARFSGTPQLIYKRAFASYQEARAHEKFLKSGAGRDQLRLSVRT